MEVREIVSGVRGAVFGCEWGRDLGLMGFESEWDWLWAVLIPLDLRPCRV